MFFHQPNNSLGGYSYNTVLYDNIYWNKHFHKNFELVYVVNGCVKCSVDENEQILKNGDFALFLSNEIHSLISEGDSKCFVTVFSGDFVHAFEKQTRGMRADGFVFRCSEDVESFFKVGLLNEEQPSLYRMKACLYAICDEYLKTVKLVPGDGNGENLMRSISDYIVEHYKEKISLSDVALRLGYNYHYLSKRFNKIFHVSFTEFLNSYRLDAALELLVETELDITEVALSSGFQSVRSFNDFFKMKMGATPSEYREKTVKPTKSAVT